MTVQELDTLLGKVDGRHTMLYPLLKTRIDAMQYTPPELPFPEEFICFEDDYYRIAREMQIRSDLRQYNTVVDIGCQYGFQSVVFPEHINYIGVEAADNRFLPASNAVFIQEPFPCDIDLSDKIAISNMSLGFFQYSCTEDELITALSKAPALFIRTSKEFLLKVMSRYNSTELVCDAERYPQYLLTRN